MPTAVIGTSINFHLHTSGASPVSASVLSCPSYFQQLRPTTSVRTSFVTLPQDQLVNTANCVATHPNLPYHDKQLSIVIGSYSP